MDFLKEYILSYFNSHQDSSSTHTPDYRRPPGLRHYQWQEDYDCTDTSAGRSFLQGIKLLDRFKFDNSTNTAEKSCALLHQVFEEAYQKYHTTSVTLNTPNQINHLISEKECIEIDSYYEALDLIYLEYVLSGFYQNSEENLLNIQDKQGNTVMHYIAKIGDIWFQNTHSQTGPQKNIVHFLLDDDGHYHIQNNEGDTPLHVAGQFGQKRFFMASLEQINRFPSALYWPLSTKNHKGLTIIDCLRQSPYVTFNEENIHDLTDNKGLADIIVPRLLQEPTITSKLLSKGR